MRDLALMAATIFFLPISLRYPAAGALAWAWFSIMNPHQLTYGFTAGAPLNSVIAVATLIGWLATPGNKRWPSDAVPWLLLALAVWMTLDTPFGAFPSYSWVFWDRVMRILALVFVAFFVCNTKARIHAMVWVIVISLGFYGVKGGVFTVVHGGHNTVLGGPGSVYSDNNQLALAVVTEIPLLFYLWRHTKLRWLRLGMMAAIVLQVLMVFGSYSRGGVIALAVMLGLLWWRSDRKVLYSTLAAMAVGTGVYMMPDKFFERMQTVNSLDSDSSFQGRVNAWKVAYLYANDHFPFGAGFYAPQIPSLFHSYLPDDTPHAAHSIYFQILGEHGWIGLALYVAILLVGLRNALVVRRQVRDRPGLRWAYDLADMSLVALLSFYVGGAALSMAYADEYLLIIALLSGLRQLTRPDRLAGEQAGRRRRHRHGADEDAEDDAEAPAQAELARYTSIPTSRSA